MELKTIHEAVPAPRIPDQPGRLLELAETLRRSGYHLAACASRLGVIPRLGINFWEQLRPGWRPRPGDLVDTLLELLIDGRPVELDRLTAQLPAAIVDTLVETGLAVRRDQLIEARVCLFPCYGKYIVTDRAAKNTAINQVMWLWTESFILGGLVKRSPRRRAIDLGTGSGVHALLASDHCQEVVAVDINPRALDFARFNAALNGAGNIQFVQGDLLDPVAGTCDLLVANPPYAPDSAAKAGDNYWSGGVGGSDLLRRIVEALPTRLDPDGACHLNALYPNPRGTTTREHFDAWLGQRVDRYQVLDQAWPVPHYLDLFSERPFVGDKSAWRFGVVSLRRAIGGPGWWRETAGKGAFFRADGSCALLADHDAG